MINNIKIPIKGFYYVLSTYTHGDRIYVAFRFHKQLVEEVKAMRGSRWHAEAEEVPSEVRRVLRCTKCWSIDLCDRNLLSFRIMQGDDPYTFYLDAITPVPGEPRLTSDGRTLTPFPHQCLMTGHQLQMRRVITAAEMGTGKTLAAIQTMELAENPRNRDFWYVSTKSGLMATMLELKLWRARKIPMLFTYEELVRTIKNNPRIRPPQLIIFDESAAIKNITAQRTQAALWIADRMRSEVEDPYIIEMCGAPQPQSPVDWWSQVEIAAPAYLREGDPNKLERRLAFTEPGAGGAYLKRVCWRDNPEKCAVCGELRETHENPGHQWQPSRNEVEHLGKRIQGLVLTVRKSEVLKWLPPKIFRRIELKPNPGTLRAARLINERTIPVIQKLTLLRMLSDGFRYEMQESGLTKLCPSCQGVGTIKDYDPVVDDITDVVCPECKGANAVPVEQRVAKYGPCPKDDALKDLLAECEDTTGRIITYAGFTGSVDRCVNISLEAGWDVIRADGRGWHAFGPNKGLLLKQNMLEAFQLNKSDFPKLAFVAQAGAAGTGLNLTASEMLVYYSNDFDANHRLQSMDRLHRPGCTQAIIVDLLHLPSDYRVLTALENKEALQKLVLDASMFDESTS